MSARESFHQELEKAVSEQLRSRRVGYLLGAGSSFLDGKGYPLACELWGCIRDALEEDERSAIQQKLDGGATGIEQALDQLDDGGATESGHRHAVTRAIAKHFRKLSPALDVHATFVERIAARTDRHVQVFSLNYDPLIERAADHAKVRLDDGFRGIESAFFDPVTFDERPYRGRPSRNRDTFGAGARPIHLLKLHGSLGWYESEGREAHRCAFERCPPSGSQLLMVPPQRRKAADTMLPPYSTLWSRFRGCLAHGVAPLNRLACFGYGFGDHHVNEVLEPALARMDFTLLVFTKALTDEAWARWSQRKNSIVITEERSSLFGEPSDGHADLWDFQRIAREV
jgi:hypothetical protein